MALAQNPTTQVVVNSTISLLDLLQSSAQFLNRINQAVNFKAVNVQYQGYVFIPANSSQNFSPIAPVVSFAVVYVRNAGPNNVNLSMTPTGGAATAVYNLDPGAYSLYISPAIGATAISGIQPGFTGIGLVTGTTTTGSLEVLLAG